MSRLRIGHCPRRAWSGAFFCLQNSNPELFRSPKIGKRCFFAVPKRLGSRNAAGRTRVFTLGIPLPACHRAAQRRQAASTRRDDLDRPPTLLGLPCPPEHRLADEYDAAQAAGEVKTKADNQHASSKREEAASARDIGLTHKQIHDARQFRDAEARDPVLSEGTSIMKVPFGRGARSRKRFRPWTFSSCPNSKNSRYRCKCGVRFDCPKRADFRHFGQCRLQATERQWPQAT